MNRTSFIPHDEDREDQRIEERAERRKLAKLPIDAEDDDWTLRFDGLDPDDPEYESVSIFAEEMLDFDRTEFSHGELACLNARTCLAVNVIRHELESYGFTLKPRAVKRETRGFLSWDNNRWSVPC